MIGIYRKNCSTLLYKIKFCCLRAGVVPISGIASRDDRIVNFHNPSLTCFRKMISVSDPNPVVVEIILSVSENYPKVYCDAQHIICAVPILPS